MSAITVRAARDDELDAIIKLWHETSRVTYHFIPIEAGRPLADRARYFRNNIAKACDLYVAHRDGELLGFLAMEGDFIDRLYVRPTLQRQGAGRALLAHAQVLSPQRLRLYTHQENHPARAFYEKFGFRAVKFSVSPPPESVPDVEYWWEPTSAAGHPS